VATSPLLNLGQQEAVPSVGNEERSSRSSHSTNCRTRKSPFRITHGKIYTMHRKESIPNPAKQLLRYDTFYRYLSSHPIIAYKNM